MPLHGLPSVMPPHPSPPSTSTAVDRYLYLYLYLYRCLYLRKDKT